MPSYDDLLAEGRRLYPGVRIGKPGRSRAYWPTVAALRIARVVYSVDAKGLERVADGPTILVGNHSGTFDPMFVVASSWWRVGAFTKIEAFEGAAAPFFRMMGQIPLRRGDDSATSWAMAVATTMLAAGGKIGIYPEGTRAPTRGKLFRLHKRVLVSVLQANPDVPVHALTTTYEPRSRRRTKVRIRVSDALPIDPRSMDADEMTAIVRDALLDLGGLEYDHRYARDVKAELRAARGKTPA